MSSVNKVILIGNVGSEPEVRYLDRGVAIANFNLATTERGYIMQNGTQVPDRTEWHPIVLWRNLAEWAERFIHKGMKLYVEGKLQTRTWEKDGQIRRKSLPKMCKSCIVRIPTIHNIMPQLLLNPSLPIPKLLWKTIRRIAFSNWLTAFFCQGTKRTEKRN